jgi:hypothetical protein
VPTHTLGAEWGTTQDNTFELATFCEKGTHRVALRSSAIRQLMPRYVPSRVSWTVGPPLFCFELWGFSARSRGPGFLPGNS